MQHLLNYSNTIVYVSDKAIKTFISYSLILVSRTIFSLVQVSHSLLKSAYTQHFIK